MILRWIPVAAALVAVACGVSGGPVPSTGPPSSPPAQAAVPTATPVDVPSGSCIFTLDVDNQTDSKVSVAVNGAFMGNVTAFHTERFYEMMDGHPPLPWSVQITRTADGVSLVSKDFPEGTLSGTIKVRDEPEEIAAGYCP